MVQISIDMVMIGIDSSKRLNSVSEHLHRCNSIITLPPAGSAGRMPVCHYALVSPGSRMTVEGSEEFRRQNAKPFSVCSLMIWYSKTHSGISPHIYTLPRQISAALGIQVTLPTERRKRRKTPTTSVVGIYNVRPSVLTLSLTQPGVMMRYT